MNIEPFKMSWWSLCPNSSEEALNLLGKMLAFDPRDRLSAADALNHPFFKDYKDYVEEDYPSLATSTPFDLSIEKSSLNEQELKNLIKKEIEELTKQLIWLHTLIAAAFI